MKCITNKEIKNLIPVDCLKEVNLSEKRGEIAEIFIENFRSYFLESLNNKTLSVRNLMYVFRKEIAEIVSHPEWEFDYNTLEELTTIAVCTYYLTGMRNIDARYIKQCIINKMYSELNLQLNNETKQFIFDNFIFFVDDNIEEVYEKFEKYVAEIK